MLILQALYSNYGLTRRRLEVSLVEVLVHNVIDTHRDILSRVSYAKKNTI